MKWFVVLLGLVLLVSPLMVSGNVVKPLVNVSNCFNLTVQVGLLDGVDVPVEFDNCGLVSPNLFYCRCYNADNRDFQLVMRNSDAVLRDPRVYSLKLRGTFFSLKAASYNVRLDDWGDYVDLGGEDYSELGDVSRVERVYVNQTVIVNRTVFVDRPVTVFQDKIKEVPIYVNRTEYVQVENNTRVLELEGELEAGKKFYNGRMAYLNSKLVMYEVLSVLFYVLVIVILGFALFKGRKKEGGVVG